VGQLHLLAIIFPRKRLNIELYRDAPEGTQPLISDSGFINTELFVEWLKHFTKFVKPSREDPVLLILDNHILHCTLDAVILFTENFITLLSVPPHAGNMMQPLDRGLLGPLKTAFAVECDGWSVTLAGRLRREKFPLSSAIHMKELQQLKRQNVLARSLGFTLSTQTFSEMKILNLPP
jgi:hypothetical protein